MIWALVMIGLVITPEGELASTRGVQGFATEAECRSGASIAQKKMREARPDAKLLIGCVPVEKAVQS
jgi:hypothetical protein